MDHNDMSLNEYNAQNNEDVLNPSGKQAVDPYGNLDPDEDAGDETCFGCRVKECFTPFRVVIMCTLCNFINYMDRAIMPGSPNQFNTFFLDTGAAESPQDENRVFGLVTMSFIISYAISVPIFGHMVHIFKPFRMMACGLIVWCIAIFFSGLAHTTGDNMGSFWLYLASRCISGVGEASFQSVAPAFIDDYAPPESKTLWLGLFYCAIYVGTAVGYAYSAAISTSPLGWAWAYWIELILMVPFVFMSAILPYRLKMRKNSQGAPRSASRQNTLSSSITDDVDEEEEKPPTFWEEARVFLTSPVCMCIAMGYAAYTAVNVGLSTYGPEILQGLQYFPDQKAASFTFGGIVAFAGFAGTPLGGLLADRYTKGLTDKLAIRMVYLKIMVGFVTMGMILQFIGLYTGKWGFLVCVGLGIGLMFAATPCITMAVFTAVPQNMRASAVGINTLLLHLFGDVPSPYVVGYLLSVWAPNCFYKDDKLNPDCEKDYEGLRGIALVVFLWLCWTVSFWTSAAFLTRKESAATRDTIPLLKNDHTAQQRNDFMDKIQAP